VNEPTVFASGLASYLKESAGWKSSPPVRSEVRAAAEFFRKHEVCVRKIPDNIIIFKKTAIVFFEFYFNFSTYQLAIQSTVLLSQLTPPQKGVVLAGEAALAG
jgi:hypothetical protein